MKPRAVWVTIWLLLCCRYDCLIVPFKDAGPRWCTSLPSSTQDNNNKKQQEVSLSTNMERLEAMARSMEFGSAQPLGGGGGGKSKDSKSEGEKNGKEAMFSLSYDPLEPPSQLSLERDLEDMLMERALRFYDQSLVTRDEMCYLVGLEDKSEAKDQSSFTMEESLTELSELAGAAGLTVIGSTYQRVSKPSTEYYIGLGKTKDIAKAMSRNKCTCVIFDTELSPAQQKNLEIAFNTENKGSSQQIKVVDRTALILDIFAQHARTKEGQLQVQLALLTYRLPRLTNMWSHLERQSAGARGRSNGGVGLRGPGEKQLESDKRQMRAKIALLNRAIDSVRRHRSHHRSRRKRLGVPVIALVGYTNAGKSTLLNQLSQSANVFVADMLFATLDPTTRRVSWGGGGGTALQPSQQKQQQQQQQQNSLVAPRCPDILLTDTVGFIQKLPTNLVAAFRATLEEIAEADVLLHVTDISNDAWRKQEAAVLRELTDMGLDSKPIVTLWNKVDLVPERKEFIKLEAKKRGQTVAVSSVTGEGTDLLMTELMNALSAQMDCISITVPFAASEQGEALISTIHDLGVVFEKTYGDDGVFLRARVPIFLREQIEGGGLLNDSGSISDIDTTVSTAAASNVLVADVDWKALAKGRHAAVKAFEDDLTCESDNADIDQQRQTWGVTKSQGKPVISSSVISKSNRALTGPGNPGDTNDDWSGRLLDFDNGEFGIV